MRKVAANPDVVAEVADCGSFNDIVTPLESGAKKPVLVYIDIPTAQKAFSEINKYLKAGGSSVLLTAKQPRAADRD